MSDLIASVCDGLQVRSAGEGAPLLWAHGLLSGMDAEDINNWFDWTTAASTMRVVRYDARGHGHSAVPASPQHCQWHALAGDMKAVAGHAGLDRCVAGGASMGAMTALEMALQWPQRVKALVLVSPPSLWEARAAQAAHYHTVARAARVGGGSAMTTWMTTTVLRTFADWPDADKRTLQAAVAAGVGHLDGHTLWTLLRGAALSNLPPRESLAQLADVPTLIVAWPGDTTHPLSSAEQLHHLLSSSELFIANDRAQFGTIAERIRHFVARHGT